MTEETTWIGGSAWKENLFRKEEKFKENLYIPISC